MPSACQEKNRLESFIVGNYEMAQDYHRLSQIISHHLLLIESGAFSATTFVIPPCVIPLLDV